jgi:formylglycine-generating enzyme required for sulfatase activity
MRCGLSSMGLVLILLASGTAAKADAFGAGMNQFAIDFVPISGATNPASGIPAGLGFTFTGVNYDYRMGTYEITNDQWDKFRANLGVPVTGSPSNAYEDSSRYTGANVPADCVTWYEAAQFVNWLNTSTGHPAAYKFSGVQGTNDYTLGLWSAAEAADGAKLYRHKDAVYGLPTENEWVKAAYWNGNFLQEYATKPYERLMQGNGTSGMGWNYFTNATGCATDPPGPWAVGSGSQELNGTYDMMGNDFEWMESPYYAGSGYSVEASRAVRGGGWYEHFWNSGSASSTRDNTYPDTTNSGYVGFRVVSVPGDQPVAGDVDLDGTVDIFDVAVVQHKYGMTSNARWKDGDFDGNGTVDIFDVALLQVNYGHGVAAAPITVPEPSTLVLATIGLASLVAFRRCQRRARLC